MLCRGGVRARYVPDGLVEGDAPRLLMIHPRCLLTCVEARQSRPVSLIPKLTVRQIRGQPWRTRRRTGGDFRGHLACHVRAAQSAWARVRSGRQG